MSIGRTAFACHGYLSLAKVYDSLPDRLADLLVKELADLYYKMYNMLTDEEKEALIARKCFEDPTLKPLSALVRVYAFFPERLADLLVKENADLYNKVYSMLTDEEKEALIAKTGKCFEHRTLKSTIGYDFNIEESENKIAEIRTENEQLENDLYNTTAACRERYKGIPHQEYLTNASTIELKCKIGAGELKINSMGLLKHLKQREDQSLLFN